MGSLFRSLRSHSRHQSSLPPTFSPTSLLTARSQNISPIKVSQQFSTSTSISTWGGGKLKTHQGTKKRFKPVSKKRNAVRPSIMRQLFPNMPGHERTKLRRLAEANSGGGIESIYGKVEQKGGARPGPLFKRGQSGKRHLNLRTSGSKLNSLGGTKVVGQGRLGWHLRKLMPYT
ncbi:unnamed protein product [Sympodiomycopsis kandeliae]